MLVEDKVGALDGNDDDDDDRDGDDSDDVDPSVNKDDEGEILGDRVDSVTTCVAGDRCIWEASVLLPTTPASSNLPVLLSSSSLLCFTDDSSIPDLVTGAWISFWMRALGWDEWTLFVRKTSAVGYGTCSSRLTLRFVPSTPTLFGVWDGVMDRCVFGLRTAGCITELTISDSRRKKQEEESDENSTPYTQ